MPLTHIETENTDAVLPSQVAEREGVSPRVNLAESFKHVPEVAAASAELEELIAIDALDVAFAAARRRLTDAVAHAASVAARDRALRLKRTEKARHVEIEKRRAAEHARRESAETPVIIFEFAGIRVTVRPEALMDSGARGQMGFGIGQIYRLSQRAWSQPRDPQRVAKEAEDLMRNGIRLGVATVEILKP
jgi:hypothetical protein